MVNIPDPLQRFVLQPSQAYTLPSFYWNVYNDEQRIKYLCCVVGNLLDQQNKYVDNNNQFNAALQELAAEFEQFQESGFDDYYREQIEQWIEDNLDALYGRFCKGVYFGLNLDGYFVAYIPENWSEIQFDTGANFELDTYGRLILRMDVDSPYNVNQTPEPNRYA